MSGYGLRTYRILSRRALKLRASCPATPSVLTRRWSSTVVDRQWSTPLAKALADAIKTTGPLSIANYMRQCLTSDLGGYYTRQEEGGTDQFGKSGDFVTSPEISQIFGELVGIWFVAEWMAQGSRSSGVQLIELGPGRGTLMDDTLRTIRNFKPMMSAIDTIYLVESGKKLREQQHALLCGEQPLVEHEIGYSSSSKYSSSLNVVWTEDVNFVPKDNNRSSYIVAHEFFDALPIHAFQSVPKSTAKPSSSITTSTTGAGSSSQNVKQEENEWRELVVSPVAPPSPFAPPERAKSEEKAEFELSVSSCSTPYSQLLPSLSPRYKRLLPQKHATIEISEASRIIASNITQFIGGFPSRSVPARPQDRQARQEPGGAALIVDYGPADTVPVNTLRGIQNHTRVSPFESPGLVDLSADVDFGALVESALEASENVEVHGPVEQAFWLESMGGRERTEALMARSKHRKTDDNPGEGTEKRIESGWKRLVDRGPNGMGKLYRAMAILPVSNAGRRPVGFGGDVRM